MNHIFQILGPNLPRDLEGFSMVTSPKGVVIIGGRWIAYKGSAENCMKNVMNYNHELFELTGDSIEQLSWSVLEQKLHYGRADHVSIPISNDTFKTMMVNVTVPKILAMETDSNDPPQEVTVPTKMETEGGKDDIDGFIPPTLD